MSTMKTYYTSLQVTKEGYVGIVYNPNTNQEVFKTKTHRTQLEANTELTEFIRNQKKSKLNTEVDPNKPHPYPQVLRPRRCCGQG